MEQKIPFNKSGSKGYIRKIGNTYRLSPNEVVGNGFEYFPIPHITLFNLFTAQLQGAIFDSTDSEISYEEEVSTEVNSDIFSYYKGRLGLDKKNKYIMNIHIKVKKMSIESTRIDIIVYYGKENPKTHHYFKHKPRIVQPQYIYLNNAEIIEFYNTLRGFYK